MNRADLLPPEVLLSLADLALVAERIVDGLLSGRHSGSERGTSTTFQSYRMYAPGDDPRRIDWKAWGRTDRVYVQEVEAEPSTDLVLVVDASGSMGHTERGVSKLRVATLAAAALGTLARRQGDRVGLVALTADGPRYHPADGSANGFHHLLTELSRLRPVGQLPTTAAVLDPILGRLGGRRIVAVFTDFYSHADELTALLGRGRAAGHEALAFHLVGPGERTGAFAASGTIRFEDMETGEIVRADARSLGSAYRDRFSRFLADTALALGRVGVPHLQLDLDRPLGPTLREVLRRRAGSR